MNVNDGMFRPDNARPLVGVSAAPLNSDITLACLFAGLKPIENLWDTLDQRLRLMNPLPQTPPQLFTAPQHEWQNIRQRLVQRLTASIVKFQFYIYTYKYIYIYIKTFELRFESEVSSNDVGETNVWGFCNLTYVTKQTALLNCFWCCVLSH